MYDCVGAPIHSSIIMACMLDCRLNCENIWTNYAYMYTQLKQTPTQCLGGCCYYILRMHEYSGDGWVHPHRPCSEELVAVALGQTVQCVCLPCEILSFKKKPVETFRPV